MNPILFLNISISISLVLSIFILGFRHTIHSIIGYLTYITMVNITAVIFKDISITFDSFLFTCVCFGMLGGIGSGLIYRSGFDTGGIDTLLTILRDKFKVPFSKVANIINGLIITSGIITFGATKAIYSIITLIIINNVSEAVLIGTSSKKMVFINSRKTHELTKFIERDLDAGYTLLQSTNGIGIFKRTIIMCVIPTYRFYTLKAKVKESVLAALELVNLSGFENRKIDKISGGQMQRVAIARAIVLRPKILLLDEPLSALDLKLRQNMQYELKEMQRNLGITFIFVTHDQEEAMVMSDRIVVMKDGIIQQLGSPKDIYNEPVNRYVANFIGESNIISGLYLRKNVVKFLGQEFKVVGYDFEDGAQVDVVIRPEDWDVVPLKQAKVKGKVLSSIFKGVHYELVVDIDGTEYTVHTYEDVKVDEIVGLNIDPYEICLMNVDGSPKKLIPLTEEDTKKEYTLFDSAVYEENNAFYGQEEASKEVK